MLREFSLLDIASELSAELLGDNVICQNISTDTRRLNTGDLYIALRGDRFDGHDFIEQAKNAGAVAAVVDQKYCDSLSASNSLTMPLLKVENTLLALGQLARWHRQQFTGPVVAVTGSAGKTSVKQLMASVLNVQFNTWMTQGNLNNHIGAPLTLLALAPEHQAAVIELGASGLGEIAYTAQFTQPQVGILTNASTSHLEGFGSLEGIVQTKGELIDYVAANGTVVLNADDPFYSRWQQRASTKKVISFGLSVDADVRADHIECSLDGVHFRLIAASETAVVNLPLLGEHNVRNALAVTAAALALDFSVKEIVKGLESATAYSGRLQWCQGQQGQRILNDSYNANPASVKAAIDVLAQGNSTWLVLGEMGELGEEQVSAHQEIGAYAKSKGIDHLVATGDLCQHSTTAFGEQGEWFATQQQLIEFLQQRTRNQDVLLVKGSRSAAMENVVAALQSGEQEY